MGHEVHGTSRAWPSQVLKYGFRTNNGSAGGVRLEAAERVECSTGAASATIDQRIVGSALQEAGVTMNYDVDKNKIL